MNTINSVGAVGQAGDASPGRSLSATVSAFLSEKAAELSPYSVAHLRSSLTGLCRSLGDPPVAAVTYAELRAYIDGLYLRYKPGTIKPVVGDIRQFFRWAKKRRHIERNPAKRLKPPRRRVDGESRAAPENDVRRVLDYLAGRLARVVWRDLFGNLCAMSPDGWTYDERQTARDLFILSFLYETGGRAGELWRLGVVAMEFAITAPGPVYCVTSTGKTGDTVLRFTGATAELWSVWYGVHPGGEFAVTGWRPDCEPLPMTTQAISLMLARQCDRAGVTRFRAHALRHAKIRRGKGSVGLETTSRLVGHGSAVVTAGYASAGEDELNAAALATGLTRRLW